MNKTTIAIVALIIAFCSGITCVLAAPNYTKFSSKFIKHFQDCDSYEEEISSEFEGNHFTTTRRIVGWRNGMCKYQEVVKSEKDKYQLDCSFTSIQLEDLYTAMKDRSKETERYELELFAEQKTLQGKSKYVVAGTTTIKGNKAYITWAKYQNNPYFCRPQKL